MEVPGKSEGEVNQTAYIAALRKALEELLSCCDNGNSTEICKCVHPSSECPDPDLCLFCKARAALDLPVPGKVGPYCSQCGRPHVACAKAGCSHGWTYRNPVEGQAP